MLDVTMAPCAPASFPASSRDEALGLLFALGANALHARRCSLYLYADHGFDLAHASGLEDREVAARLSAEGSVVGVVMRSRVPLLVQDVAAYPALPVHPERYATASFMSVPILVEHEVVGVLNAADRQDGAAFSESDLHSAEMVARSMGAVLHSELLARRAVGDGEIDPVTGLYNARHFEKRLAQEVERAQRARVPLTLLLLRVDSFGDVAARVGVQTAGVLMRCVGEMAAGTVRQSDVLALRRDDEIAVLLPSTPLDKARRVARAIAREVAHDKLPAQLRYDLETLHSSIGLAALAPSMSGAELLQRAEEAAEEARTRGDAVVAAAGDELAEVARRQAPRAAHQQAISTAMRLGIPYLASPAEAAMVSAVRLLSVEMARTYVCFPVAFEGGTLTLAMADPVDGGAIQAVSQYTNMAVYPVASPREKILQAIATMMSERKPRAELRVRVRLAPAGTPRAFAARVSRIAECLAAQREDDVTELAIEGTVTVQCASAAQHARVLSGLSALPAVSLRTDRHDDTLLHLTVQE